MTDWPALVLWISLYFCLGAGVAAEAGAALPETTPEAVGIDPGRLARLDGAVARAVADKVVPGGVLLAGRGGKVAYARAFGDRALVPAREAMTRDTVFDLASLTKPVATATAVMVLVERGVLRLDDKLSRLLPEFDNHGKGAVTLEQLLRHRAGMIADNPLGDYDGGADAAWAKLATLDLARPPGTAFVYSDVGFLILGRAVERASGLPLDDFAREHVFRPAGMNGAHFRRPGGAYVGPERVAPTAEEGGAMLRGLVHDPRARALDGVAGHAGLFAAADDLAVYAQMLLDDGLSPSGGRVLSPLAARRMTDPGDTPVGERRGLGWDVDTAQSAPRGSLFGPDGFGHTGFTGTSLWVDRETRSFVVLLTSRLHPDGKNASPGRLRSEVATIFAAAIVAPATAEGRAR